mmetsp:Transcript_30986/g.86967  ORF Transcript_30986/g.86967 Transcript_30986/m.86967 type:complete len:299 (+) Transcript_30986:642-1538(+)
MRPIRVAHEHDLVAGVREKRQQALPLDVEAVGGAPDLRGPEEAELPRRVLVRRDAALVLNAGRLPPLLQLLLRQTLQLSGADRVGVAPLRVVAFQDVCDDLLTHDRHLVGWNRPTIERVVHGLLPLHQGPQRQQKFALQGSEHWLKFGLRAWPGGVREPDLTHKSVDHGALQAVCGHTLARLEQRVQSLPRSLAPGLGLGVCERTVLASAVLSACGRVLPTQAQGLVVDPLRALLRQQTQGSHDTRLRTLRRRGANELRDDRGVVVGAAAVRTTAASCWATGCLPRSQHAPAEGEATT